MKNKIIAHRGIFNNIDIPENSMKAFEKALKLNYPIELDVQLTKDNVLVVLHDLSLKRMTGNSLILQELHSLLLKLGLLLSLYAFGLRFWCELTYPQLDLSS